MMKKLMGVFLGGLALLLVTSQAFGDDQFYVEFMAGWSVLEDSEIDDPEDSVNDSLQFEYDSAAVYGIALGSRQRFYRVEAELMYRSYDMGEFQGEFTDGSGITHRFVSELLGDVELTTVLLNGYVNLYTMGAVTPYIGAGIGVARYELNDVKEKPDEYGDEEEGLNEDDMVLALQYGGGLEVAVTDSITMDFSYRHLELGDSEIKETEIEVEGDTVLLGVRFSY